MEGAGYLNVLLEEIDEDQIPRFLGGTNDNNWGEGPWNEYELIDGHNPGDVVGVRHKGDPNG